VRLKLTPFKFPFVVGQLLVAVVMAQHASNYREEWRIVIGSLGVSLIAVGAALHILKDEE
jgi:hypothetical protein